MKALWDIFPRQQPSTQPQGLHASRFEQESRRHCSCVLTFSAPVGGLNAADERVAPSTSILPIMLKRNGSDGMLEIVSTMPNARRLAHVGQPGEHAHGVRFIDDGRRVPAVKPP